MPQKFFLYARKSTDTEEKQILSIEAQLAELKIFAERENLAIKEVLTEHRTAKEPGRPVFNSMMERIAQGEASGILAWHPDRLARNSVDGGLIIHLLDQKKLQHLKFPTFWFENTPQGKFMLNISFGQSKYYVDNLSENVERGMRHKVRRGEWLVKAPPGYLNDRISRKVILNPTNSHLVKKLFETFATGDYTVQSLIKMTFEWGLTNKKGGPLVKDTLYRIFSNPFYYGLLRYKGELFPAAHEPLISKTLFDKVQEALQLHGKPRKHEKTPFPLLGFMKCPACDSMITAEKQKGHHYYRCTRKKGKCTEPYTREEALAQKISQAINSVALTNEGYAFMANALDEEAKALEQPIAEEKALGTLKLKELQTKLDRLLDAHLEGLVGKSEYQAKKDTLLNSKVDLEAKMAKLETGTLNWLEPFCEFLKTALGAGELAKSGDLAAQKNFLKKKRDRTIVWRRGGSLLSSISRGLF